MRPARTCCFHSPSARPPCCSRKPRPPTSCSGRSAAFGRRSRAIGYWQQMDKTKQGFRGEWYVSGDMVRRDADGYFTYCGRADDLLKVSGKWLAPQEVENCLLQHPAVKEVAVVGVVGEHGLVKPHAFVVATAAHHGLAEELQAFVRERLQPYPKPRQGLLLRRPPPAHPGEVDRARLRRP